MYIGIDIGGTHTRVAAFDALGAQEFDLLARFPTQQDYDEQMHRIIEAVQQSRLQEIAGIGVSIAGRMARDGRSVIVAPNLPNYVHKPFATQLTAALGCQARLAHDTVCGLLAEKMFGHIRDVERCAYLTVSTGTGAAIQLAKGGITLTSSIEIGHQLLDGNQRACLCGQVGCLETYTGGRQIALRYGVASEEMRERAFWEDFCEKLALGLVNLAMLTRIDAVTIGGAMMLNQPSLLGLLQGKVDAKLCNAALELSLAVLGENAPLIGAAALLGVPEETILH